MFLQTSRNFILSFVINTSVAIQLSMPHSDFNSAHNFYLRFFLSLCHLMLFYHLAIQSLPSSDLCRSTLTSVAPFQSLLLSTFSVIPDILYLILWLLLHRLLFFSVFLFSVVRLLVCLF